MAAIVRAEDTDLPHVLDRARAGEELIVVRGGAAIARVVPIPAVTLPAPPDEFPESPEERRARRARGFGMFAGQIDIGPEFFEPLPEEELRLWEGRGDEE